MTDLLSLIPAEWIAYAIAAITGLIAIFGYGAAKKRQGKAEASAKADREAAQGYQKTMEDALNAPVANTPADAREWLRSRKPGQP